MQTGRHIYELNGTTWQADACSDNGTEYPHETVYKNAAGQEVCAPIINQAAGTVTRQSRKQIVVNGVEQFITECKPDTANIAIQSTIDGCDNPSLWSHDLAAGASYGRERFYYQLDGVPQYVTECQDSEIAYPHQVETTGWQNHDDQLFAYRLTTVYIEGTPKGRYNIKTSEVLPGEPQMAYVYSGEAPTTNGEHFYEGCTRFDARDLVQSYERPDQSIHKVVIDEAAPLNLGDKCNLNVDWGAESYRRWTAGQRRTSSVCGKTNYSVWHSAAGSDGDTWTESVSYADHCNYTASVGTKTIVREDGTQIGEPVSLTCETVSSYASYNQSRSGFQSWINYRGNSGSFPAHTNAVKTNCMGDWGWWQ